MKAGGHWTDSSVLLLDPLDPSVSFIYLFIFFSFIAFGNLTPPALFKISIWAPQVVLAVKNSPANAGYVRGMGLIPGWENPMGKAWQWTLVFLPGESRGQRNLEGYSP